VKCLGCLKQSTTRYCTSCKKKLFGKNRVKPTLDFDKQDYISAKTNLADSLSISGVQDKILLQIDNGKLVPSFSNTAYILKPVPNLDFVKMVDDIVPNEHITMLIASKIYKIECASCALIEFSNHELALLVKRFDRVENQKIKVEDFASIANKNEAKDGKNYKYDYSYEKMADLIQRYIPAFKIELIKFFKLVLFNYLVGNGDAHLKNFSIIQTSMKDYKLSPAYDLLATSIHLPNESRTALELFEEYESEAFRANGFYSQQDFLEFGKLIGIDASLTNAIIKDFLSKKDDTLILIEHSFLSPDAKVAYKKLYLDRLRAVGYLYSD